MDTTANNPRWINDNPFITEFAGLPVADVLAAHKALNAGSGGYWLGRVRYQLNLMSVWHREEIRRAVDPHSYNVIVGRSR